MPRIASLSLISLSYQVEGEMEGYQEVRGKVLKGMARNLKE